MRLRERDKRPVTVFKSEGFDDDAYLWGDSFDIDAAVYPNTRAIDAKVYGDRIREMKLLLYDGERKLDVGMGVSEDGGEPTHRIVSVEPRSHQTAVLAKIHDGRRGDGY